jgi:hypothetical protein
MGRLLISGVLTLLALDAARAEAVKWCSDGFEKPAHLTRAVSPAEVLVLSIGGKEIKTIAIGSEELTRAALQILHEGGEEDPEQQVWIYQDRVFWPCDQ